MTHANLQLNLFDSTSLDSEYATLFWGELEGEEGEAPGSVVPPVAAPAPEPFIIPQVDYRLPGVRSLAAGWKDRARDNIAALRLLAELEAEGRNATSSEQVALANFIGFGAGELANNLFPHEGEAFRAGWEEIGKSLRAVTTEQERAGLARATQYAHYTPEYIVHALWTFMTARGFAGGSVLEPGCGTGLFIATCPEKLAGNVAFTGIEMDPLTARISRKLYPNQWIRNEDFTKAKLAQGYDLAIGNPPFSSRTVNSPDHRDMRGFSLHDWFIARSIEALRPGGIAAFVTSRHTMDKSDAKVRKHIAETADLMGAIRLPATSMRAEAGTDVVVDVLIFRKREIGDFPGDTTWLELADIPDSDQGEGPLRINRHFVENRNMALGRHGWTTTQFGPDYTCEGQDGISVEAGLIEALAGIAPDIRFPTPLAQRITRPTHTSAGQGRGAT